MKIEIFPTTEICSGCKHFIPEGTVVADRFLVKKNACVLLNAGEICICLAVANSEALDQPESPDSDLIEGNAYTR